MKRKELTCGMQVEIRDGAPGRRWTNYRDAIVLDVEPWDEVRFYSDRSNRFRRSPDGRGQGVAVMARPQFDRSGDAIIAEVVQLRALEPAGTRAKVEAEREAWRRHDDRVQEERAAAKQRKLDQQAAYADALGLKPDQVFFNDRLDSVTVPTSKLDELMEKLGIGPDLMKEPS